MEWHKPFWWGSDGFNSGMMARETWMPKNVDQLRTANNPKLTYQGKVLAGKNIAQRGRQGEVWVSMSMYE